MNRKRTRNTRNNEERKSQRIMRCSFQNKPVFEHETCTEFKPRGTANDQKICKNCKYSS